MAKIPQLRAVTSPEQIQVAKRVPELLRCPWEKPITGIVLCDALFEFPTHYDGNHTVICTDPGPCELCDVVPLRRYYLIAILDRNSGSRAWYQLPDKVGRVFLEDLQQRQHVLLGSTVTLGRVRKSQRAPVTITLDPWAKCPELRGNPMTPTETLERVFNSPKLASKANLKPL